MVFKPVIDFINKYDKFIITAHETPDGDAIGSEYSLFRALKKINKTVKIFNSDPTSHKFGFVDINNDIKVLENHRQLPKDITDYALFILDTNDTNNIGLVSDLVLPKVKEYFIIDHHENSDKDIQTGNLIHKSASSTAEILYQIIKELGIKMDRNIAEALFMAIVYDTGSFVYPKTTALTFEIAFNLVSLGVNPNKIYSKVYECNSISSVILQSKVLSTLTLVFKNHVAIQTMDKNTIMQARGKYEESDLLINVPLKAEAIKVSIFFKQNLNDLFRCSMRSKGDIDVAAIAKSFGGGGHKNAAGFKCRQSIDIVREEVLEKLKPYFK